MSVEAQECTQVVAVGECLCDVGLPLSLLQDKVNDFMWVGAVYVPSVAIDLGKVLNDL